MTRNNRKDNNKQTSQSKRARSAGDVEHTMMLQVVGIERLNVIHVIKKVTYPHAVRVSKISEKPEPRKVKAQERVKAKAIEKVKVITKQIRLIRTTLITSVNSVGRIAKVGNRAKS